MLVYCFGVGIYIFFSFFSVVGVTYGGTLSFVDDFENKICYFF